MHTQRIDLRPLLKAVLVPTVLAAICASFPTHVFGQTGPRLTPLFTSELGSPGMVEAAPLHVNVQGVEYVLIATTNGTLVAVEPKTGVVVWSVSLPRPQGENARLLATPARAGDYLVLAYETSQGGVRRRHLVSVVDLRTGTVADQEFATLQLDAQKPAMDGGVVTFNPPTAMSRAALAGAGGGTGLGHVYVSFGNAQDIQPWHGWIFEIDLEAWRSGGTTKAISAVLLTTPQSDCGQEGRSGSFSMICGAGVWSPAGPQVIDTPAGYELLVTTGNGELDLDRKDYAQSVLRLSKGLNFDPACDPLACTNFDPLSPSEQCMGSCRNLAIPRLLLGEPPLSPASGRCDGKTFLECLAANDWDFGANAPIRITLPSGQEVIVQPGKDGALYMFDALHMGRLYDREPIVEPCGVAGDQCSGRQWLGTISRNHPVVLNVDGRTIVIVPTFMPNASQPAGVVATEIIDAPGAPKFAPFWQAPRFDSPEAHQRFRNAPSHLAVSISSVDGGHYVWVVDPTGPVDTLLGIRVRDGTIIAETKLAGRSDSIRPLHHDGVLYVPAKPPSAPGVLEAFSIAY
jgi:PQQ-like domain